MHHLFYFLFLFLTPKSEKPLHIGILSFSAIDADLKNALKENALATYNCTITEIPGITPLPASAYYKPRNRYRASEILKFLKNLKGYDKVIGITSKDISVTHGKVYDWGVLGLGYRPGKCCVISTFRMKTENRILLKERFVKVGLHELGHTMGLPHCNETPDCFMADARGSIKTVDRSSRSLCVNCKRQL